MAEKIKVLQTVGSLGIGGTEIFVMNYFRHIDKKKFQVDFLIFDGTRMDFYEEVTAAGSRVYVCPATAKGKYKKLCSEMHKVRKLLKEHHYDIVHCHGNSFIELFRAAIPAKRMKGTYVITHSHNPGEPTHTRTDNLCRAALKAYVCHITDRGCACSDVAAHGKYTEKFMRTPRYQLINNAINTQDYLYNPSTRREVRKEMDIGDEDFVIGHVGRISYQKNPLFLIDILAELSARLPNAKLLLVGDGELRRNVEEKIKALHLDSSVCLTGKCDSAARYYHAMDCFCLPSIYEGFPFVLVEAQVNGLRCVVSDTVSRSVNVTGEVIFKALSDGAGDWAEAIRKSCAKRMGKAEVRKITQQYELQNEVKKIEKMYEELLKH